MVVHAALAALLSQLTGCTDIPIGIGGAGRNHPALDGLVGMFANSMVLRTNVGGVGGDGVQPTFAQLLAQVRTHALRAFDHQDVPFSVLVDWLNPTPSLSHAPLRQVILAWQSTQPAKWTLGDLEITAIPLYTGGARMDLTLAFNENFTDTGQPADISRAVEYRTDVYNAETVLAWLNGLEQLLSAMVVDPQRRPSTINLI